MKEGKNKGESRAVGRQEIGDSLTLKPPRHERNEMTYSAAVPLSYHRWDCRYKLRNEWPVPSNQQCLCYIPGHTLLYSGSVDGQVNAALASFIPLRSLDPEGVETLTLERVSHPHSPCVCKMQQVLAWNVAERELRSSYTAHTDMVMDLCPLNELDLLASASLDGTICIWDIYLHRQRQRLDGGGHSANNKGIVSLAFCDDCRLLASGGYDHDVLIYSPFVETLITRLQGHHAPITNVTALKGKPELISGNGRKEGTGGNETVRVSVPTIYTNTRSHVCTHR